MSAPKAVYVLGGPNDPEAFWLRREVDQYATLGMRDEDEEAAITVDAKDISDLIAALTDLHASITRWQP